MSYADLSEEQKEKRRGAVDKYRKSRRGRPRTRTPEQKRAQQIQASRRAYAKKTGQPWVKRHVNQYGEVDRIGNVKWDDLKAKWKDFEGTRLEKSEKPPIFLSEEMRRRQAEK